MSETEPRPGDLYREALGDELILVIGPDTGSELPHTYDVLVDGRARKVSKNLIKALYAPVEK